MGQAPKISPPLQRKAAAASPSEMVEVVVELVPGGLAPAGAPQADRTRGLDQAFKKRASPVEDAIRDAGGQILEHLWISDCLRARVPASALQGLAGVDLVSLIDVPHAITRER